MSGAKTSITPAYTVEIPGQYLNPHGNWHRFLMGADEMLELHAAIGEALGLTTYSRGETRQASEIAETLCTADSILSLLHHRGILDTDRNREDVAKACAKVSAMRKYYEPLLQSPSPTTE